jgi:hypothetical protein
VLLTITTTYQPATDLGYLLHKHPARVQRFGLGWGDAVVFYPEATESRCTAALLLEINPVALVRGREHQLSAYVSPLGNAGTGLSGHARPRTVLRSFRWALKLTLQHSKMLCASTTPNASLCSPLSVLNHISEGCCDQPAITTIDSGAALTNTRIGKQSLRFIGHTLLSKS